MTNRAWFIATPTYLECNTKLQHTLSHVFPMNISFESLRERSNELVHGGVCHFRKQFSTSRSYLDRHSSSQVIARNLFILRRNRVAPLRPWRLPRPLNQMCYTMGSCRTPRRIPLRSNRDADLFTAGEEKSCDCGQCLQRKLGLASISTTLCTNFAVVLESPQTKF